MPWRAPRPGTRESITDDFQLRAERHMQSVIRLSDTTSSINAVVVVDPDSDKQDSHLWQCSEDETVE